MEPLLLNIIAISFIECSNLQNITVIHGVGVQFNYFRNFKALPIIGHASCECTSKVEGRTRLFTSTLNAKLCEPFDPGDRHLAFLLKCFDGHEYLLGAPERPYPVVSTTTTLPGKDTEASGYSLTVEYTDTLGLMSVLD